MLMVMMMMSHLRTMTTAVILSQPIPDMVSAATSLSSKSSTTCLVFFFFSSYFTISIMPWLF